MSTKPHASSITTMVRGVELIEQMKVHPHQQEILQLAKEQLEDMNTFDVVTDDCNP